MGRKNGNISENEQPQHAVGECENAPKRAWHGPAILLMDLDAFFASVEQLDHPEWRGKPVIVGGNPAARGVVSTASYEARRYGVHSAMPSSTAARLCPEAIWTPGHFRRYREMSQAVMKILYDESPHLMQVSIDEAFLDVSPTRTNRTHPADVARRIQERVAQLGITCSVGVGASKSVAKIASNQNKPRGLTVVYPEDSEAFLAPLDVGEMSGVGPVAQAKLRRYGIRTLGDMAHADTALLREVFGKNAGLMAARARGVDTPVNDEREPAKSVSNEMSFAKSLTERTEVEAGIATMAHKVGRRLRRKGLSGSTLHLKVRYEDLTIRTCQRRRADLGTNELTWLPLLGAMLDEVWDGREPVRLVGVGVSGFDGAPVQTSLFDDELAFEPRAGLGESVNNKNAGAANASPLVTNARKNEELLRAGDAIATRFGEGAVLFGHELRSLGATTGTAAKNPEDYKD